MLGDENSSLTIIGRPYQEMFEATLKIKENYSGILNLTHGDKEVPELSALNDFTIIDE